MTSITHSRRAFLVQLGHGAAAIALLPVAACGAATASTGAVAAPSTTDPLAIPLAKPEGFDAIRFNRERGLAGAIPESYRPSILGADGDVAHLGKHLPYVVAVSDLPAGMIAIMWGDPSKGHTRHPNAPRSESNAEGHWYNWIRVRKAVAEDAEEAQSDYASWPEGELYRAFEGTDITLDSGKNTVYLVRLPADVRAGDLIRIHAHCLTHGEYVDFVEVPA